MRRFYVYTHCRLDSGRPFYVGKGQNRRHISRDGRSDWWRRIVDKHGLESRIVANFEHESDAFALERVLIATGRAFEMPLINITDGGEGSSGRRHSEEAKRKISLANKGREKSPEVRKALSERMKNFKHSEESKAKIGAHTKRNKERGLCGGRPRRPIRCIETGRVFEMRIHAVEWLRQNGHPKADSPSIKRCMERSSSYAYGFHWENL